MDRRLANFWYRPLSPNWWKEREEKDWDWQERPIELSGLQAYIGEASEGQKIDNVCFLSDFNCFGSQVYSGHHTECVNISDKNISS